MNLPAGLYGEPSPHKKKVQEAAGRLGYSLACLHRQGSGDEIVRP